MVTNYHHKYTDLWTGRTPSEPLWREIQPESPDNWPEDPYFTMSSFSNAETGNKPADPYTQKNLEEPSLKEKVEDLLNFMDKTKFCMMTTQTANSDLLASRAMALAAKA